MNAQHTSSTCTHESPALTMLRSAVPEGVRLLASCYENLPTPLGCPVETLDTFETTVERRAGQFACRIGITGILPCLNWWIQVAEALATHDPAFEKQRVGIIPLLNDVLSSYAAAFAETERYAGADYSESEPCTAHLELFRRYRIFTKYLCYFADELWPDVELDWLHEQA